LVIGIYVSNIVDGIDRSVECMSEI